jgi:HJR/Mrr/RecB family endonuclease
MLEHPLLNKELRLPTHRVWVVAGWDMDFPSGMYLSQAAALGVSYRLLISRVPRPYQLATLEGWDVRRLDADPDFHMLISDNHAQVTRVEGENIMGLGFIDDAGPELDWAADYFENLWRDAEPYASLQSASRLVKQGTEVVYPREQVSSWGEILLSIANDPDRLKLLSPREFEELIAELLASEQFNVRLTPASKDGGADIIAWSHTSAGKQLLLVECRQYFEPLKIGVETVRALYGVVESERATKGIVVTTSTFTRGARQFERALRYRIDLRDRQQLIEWIRRVGEQHR